MQLCMTYKTGKLKMEAGGMGKCKGGMEQMEELEEGKRGAENGRMAEEGKGAEEESRRAERAECRVQIHGFLSPLPKFSIHKISRYQPSVSQSINLPISSSK